MYIISLGYNIDELLILFASTCAGYILDASTADMYLSKPFLKQITSPPMFVKSLSFPFIWIGYPSIYGIKVSFTAVSLLK